jgi:hypothetical protein
MELMLQDKLKKQQGQLESCPCLYGTSKKLENKA